MWWLLPDSQATASFTEYIGLLRDSLQAKSFKIKGLDALSLKGASYDSITHSLWLYAAADGLLPFLSVEQNIKVQIDLSHHDKDKDDVARRTGPWCSLDIGHLVAKKAVKWGRAKDSVPLLYNLLPISPALLLIDEPTSALMACMLLSLPLSKR